MEIILRELHKIQEEFLGKDIYTSISCTENSIGISVIKDVTIFCDIFNFSTATPDELIALMNGLKEKIKDL